MAVIDRSNQYLKVFKKDGTFVSAGTKGASSVAITGLTAKTVVASGDYQVAFDLDATSKLSSSASGKVDVPAFTVLGA